MALPKWMQRAGKGGSDRLVGIASGQIPLRTLDESRLAFRLVTALAIVAFLGSGWLVWRTISTKARLPNPLNVNSATTSVEILALKTKDTDEDGLNDYDELFTYSSSPYLFSSAGDEISDSEKVRQGLNPNCPKDKACSAPTVDLTVQDSENVSADFLRRALIASGAPAATVEQLDDAAVLNLYQQAVGQVSTAPSNNNINGGAGSSNLSLDDLNNLTPTQIRSLLQQNGVSADSLQGVSDETLKAIFQQTLNSSSSGS